MKKDVEETTCEIISCSSTKFIEYGDRRPCGHHLQNCEECMGIVRPGRPLYKCELRASWKCEKLVMYLITSLLLAPNSGHTSNDVLAKFWHKPLHDSKKIGG
jgi:hypothetical protein